MLQLNPEETIARARADLRIGAAIAVLPGGGRSAGIILAAEEISEDRLRDLFDLGVDVDLAVTRRRAETLKARCYDEGLARIILSPDVSIRQIHAAADPALALAQPMMGPFKTRRDGDAATHQMGIRIAKSARLLPSVVVASMTEDKARNIADMHKLTVINGDMLDAADEAAADLTHISSARVPLTYSEDARVHVWRPASGEEEHYSIEIGAPDRSLPVLSRLHSACFTGDLIGSMKCDCGPQLRAALSQIGTFGTGVLLYLNQEGRGIGLANKMRAYSLQDEGFDTVEANHRLGFEDDERDFRIGTRILQKMGFSAVRLMTNNPNKVAAMEAAGISVADRVPLIVGETVHNLAYLDTKAKKSGHLF